MKRLKFIVLLVSVLSLSACSWFSSKDDALQHEPADSLYSQGVDALHDGNYSSAVRYFEALTSNYPFGNYAQKGQLYLIHAYYESGDPASSVAAAQSYIHLYPRAKDVDYAYYMKGVANFAQDRGVLLRYLPNDVSERDPGTMKEAYNDFNELVSRFPESKFVPDARQRMVYLRNIYAEKEMHAANYYFRRGAYVAASNRANYVVKHYQQAPAVPRALALMVVSYQKLGLKDASSDALKMLEYNFPNSEYLSDAEEKA